MSAVSKTSPDPRQDENRRRNDRAWDDPVPGPFHRSRFLYSYHVQVPSTQPQLAGGAVQSHVVPTLPDSGL